MHRYPHLLNASTNLLGFSFVIIGALKLTNSDVKSYADECVWVASGFFLTAIVCSYWVIRQNYTSMTLNFRRRHRLHRRTADAHHRAHYRRLVFVIGKKAHHRLMA